VKLALPILLTLVLTACGGGGGGGGPSPASSVASGAQIVVSQNGNFNSVYNTAVGDLNGDGRDDVVVAGWMSDTVTSYIWVFIQNADGTLSDRTQTVLGTNTHQGNQRVFIADFDNDGHNDIWLPGFRDGNAMPPANSTMFWGTGGLAQFTKQVLPDLVTAHGACIDDLNGDGKIDMIVAGGWGGSVGGVYYNMGNRQFVLDQTVLPRNNYFSSCAVMHQANGNVDIFLSNNGGVNGFTDNINVYNSNMVFQSATGVTKPNGGIGDAIDSLAVDLNNDGVKDLIVRVNGNGNGVGNNGRSIYFNTGNDAYTFSTRLDTEIGNDYYSYATTLNGMAMVLLPGEGTATRLYQVNNGLVAYKSTAFTDMNAGRPGKAAAVYQNPSSGKIYMLQLINQIFYTQEMK
jgi:FG-GAP-like repeat